MRPWTSISPADLFTLANGILGFLAITYILDEKFLGATALLLLSMVMDGLDGYIARRYGSKHTRGQVLDSISDSISFAFAPALLVYAEFRSSGNISAEGALALICAVSILATGLFRLARFSAGGYQLSHFVGMPAPAAALVILLLCLLFGAEGGAEDPDYYFTIDRISTIVLGFGFLVSVLMASEILYPKAHGKIALATGIGLLLALLPFIAGIALVGDQELYTAFSRTATSIALALALVYVFGGPVYEKLKGGKSG
jgi:CDP-diacylglycerol--serine O-phosphatidyltransferase